MYKSKHVTNKSNLWHKKCSGGTKKSPHRRFHRGTKKMGWSEFDDGEDDRDRSKQSGRRYRKRFEQDEDETAYKQKRSGKRFHRRKTFKDEFWQDDKHRGSQKNR